VKAVNESCLNILDFLQKSLAIENRGYTNKVRLRGLYVIKYFVNTYLEKCKTIVMLVDE
jgi:hypothetical protein